MLEKLNKLNDVKIYSVRDKEFKTYGRIIEGYDFSKAIKYMEDNTTVPNEGNVYFPSIPELEKLDIKNIVEETIYGGMPIQFGYCNGKNSTYNGFEYHKGSEINVAVTSFMLVLGHVWDIENNTYTVGKEQVFFVEKGTAIEFYQTTLHLSPCKVEDSGFKAIVVLPKGTNTPIEKNVNKQDTESELLLQRNKWVIAHKDRLPLVKQGAHIGLIGENKELKY